MFNNVIIRNVIILVLRNSDMDSESVGLIRHPASDGHENMQLKRCIIDRHKYINMHCCHWLQVEHPSMSHKSVWRKVVSTQRKRAVMACFRMIPLHNLPK